MTMTTTTFSLQLCVFLGFRSYILFHLLYHLEILSSFSMRKKVKGRYKLVILNFIFLNRFYKDAYFNLIVLLKQQSLLISCPRLMRRWDLMIVLYCKLQYSKYSKVSIRKYLYIFYKYLYIYNIHFEVVETKIYP